MTEVRALIDAELAATLPAGYIVHPYSVQLDGVTGPTLLLRLGKIVPRRDVGPRVREYQGAVLAVAPLADVSLATAVEVDQLAEDVLHAIDQCQAFSWTTAERVSVDDTWAGWEIAITTAPLTHQETTP